MPHIAFIGLGSNLNDPIAQVRRAITELSIPPDTRRVACSGLYQSPPLGPQDQPDYINAVAKLETLLEPRALLDALLALERAHDRVRNGQRWGPRTLDLDLLLYNDQVIQSEGLRVPHPRLHERPFVLYPLQEVAGDLEVPGRGRLSALMGQCPPGALKRLALSPCA